MSSLVVAVVLAGLPWDAPRRPTPSAAFVPTPPDVIAKMFELAKLGKDDVLYDLGSGDGRIVVAAAKTHGCKAIGVELDKALVKQACDRAAQAGVEKLVRFDQGDLFETDFSEATVIALYITPTMSKKLIPRLNALKPGSRVVVHAFAIPGITPDNTVRVRSTSDDIERPVYLYTVPLKPAPARMQP